MLDLILSTLISVRPCQANTINATACSTNNAPAQVQYLTAPVSTDVPSLPTCQANQPNQGKCKVRTKAKQAQYLIAPVSTN
jgi:hypothetical protein